jgi:head-tail adaptor
MRPVEVVNDLGEAVAGTPATVATRWAKVKTLTGREIDFADRVAAEMTFTVELREPIDIEATDFLVWDSRTLQIEARLPQPRKGYLMLACKETV